MSRLCNPEGDLVRKRLKSELTLSRVVIPPGARNQRHYHVNSSGM